MTNESISKFKYDKENSINTVLKEELVGNSSIDKFKNVLTLLKEEVVADGNSEHNPYAKRWKYEREQLKNFILNNGKLMTSRENGKTYMVYYDTMLSNLIGLNYCVCLQWDQLTMKPGSTIYVRAFDKFTSRIFKPKFDDRGKDNVRGTQDDLQPMTNYANNGAFFNV